MAFTGHEPGGAEFPQLWRGLQQVGLNAYEARTYLVLLGHPRFRALEVASRARVPRQKIYEVLESLVEKGFARVVKERTKLFSAVEPALAIPGFVDRKRRQCEQELAQQARHAAGLLEDLKAVYDEGRAERGPLDCLKIISEPAQSAYEYRRLLGGACREHVEFARPPFAVDVLDEDLVRRARVRGVQCRVLIDPSALETARLERLESGLAAVGAEVRVAAPLPLKMAVFDGSRGLIALLDPVVTRPAWTTLLFDHPGFGEAMRGLFDAYWSNSRPPERDADGS
jgi:hypothetical protein